MKIPDFLRPEYEIPEDPEGDEMMELCRQYKEIFGTHPMTEPSTYTTQEWIDMLNECIKKRITLWELWGEEYDPEADY